MTNDRRPKPPPPPILQELVGRAGRRLAARRGEPYDPMRHAGWPQITEEQFREHQEAVEAWKRSLGDWY